tara:strand:- start:750 stop:908 length:159 start_codon:yes stop_codon:yes gene_type:complete
MEMAERIAIVLELNKKLETLVVGNTATAEGLLTVVKFVHNPSVAETLLRQYQ